MKTKRSKGRGRGVSRASGTARDQSISDRRVSSQELESQVAAIIANMIRVLRILGFDESLIQDEVRRAIKVEKIPRLKPLTGHGDLNIQARLLARWADEAQYSTELGRPRDLPVKGPAPSFEALVRSELPNESSSKCLTDLVRSGAITRLRNGRVRWCSRVAVRTQRGYALVEDSLRLVDAFLGNVYQNLTFSATGRGQPLFERGIAGFEIAPGDVPELAALLRRHGMSFVEIVDTWLTRRERHRIRAFPNSKGVHPYVGMFLSVSRKKR